MAEEIRKEISKQIDRQIAQEMNKFTTSRQEKPWWKGGVIYQVYPRSYFDTKANGMGDLKGVVEKLDHIASLGVDALWLSPFFKSPMKDFGYDVSDYCHVDPSFGSLDDFKLLVKEAHQRNLKVIIDQILSHTSDEHPWFQMSRQDKKNEKADWYVWADPKEDGTPPNNWQSIFGGSAWAWHSAREQYYLHNFLKEQPDLNFHHPEVQQSLLETVEFWLKLGVDGFRLDTVNFYYHDKELRDNPPAKMKSKTSLAGNPYTHQSHVYDKSQKENLTFLKKLRKLLNQYGDTTLIGEVGDDERGLEIIADYTKDNDKLHMAYGFDFLGDKLTAEEFAERLNFFKEIIGDGWICWSFGNHDVARVVSRWATPEQLTDKVFRTRLAKMLIALLGALPGSICLYQGEELGLEEAVVAYEDLRDPFGITFYPKYVGRDGCRTPMVWTAEKNGGFSKAAKTWLPVYQKHLAWSVENQENDEDSILNFYRNFLTLRKKHKIWQSGEFKVVEASHPILVLEKSSVGFGLRSNLFVFNLAANEASYALPSSFRSHKEAILAHNATLAKEEIQLGAFGFLIAEF